MGKKSFKKHQKLYKMKGCSKKNKKSKRHLVGGSNSSLAYTGKPIVSQSNPFFAYTSGGGTSDNINLPTKYDVMNPNTNLPLNPYGANPALPNTGPETLSKSTIPTNQGSFQFGGSCGSCGTNMNIMTGGSCGSCTNVMKGGSCGSCTNVMKGGSCGSCGTNMNIMTGGGCGCGLLTGGKRLKKQKGGKTLDPQGLVGQPWGPSPAKWPGVDSINGNRNYLAYNELKVDPQTALISVGANRPFLYGGKKHSKTKRRKQRGGAFSNLLGQDFINLGRQIQYNMGSTYNAINGYPAPTQVLPWQGQLPRTPNLNTIRGAAL